MVFENGVKNIQAEAYNGARTVIGSWKLNYGVQDDYVSPSLKLHIQFCPKDGIIMP